MDLFDFLHLERHNKHIPQYEIAKKAGVGQNMISHWECKRRRPRIDLLMVWGEVLGYKLKWVPLDE